VENSYQRTDKTQGNSHRAHNLLKDTIWTAIKIKKEKKAHTLQRNTNTPQEPKKRRMENLGAPVGLEKNANRKKKHKKNIGSKGTLTTKPGKLATIGKTE